MASSSTAAILVLGPPLAAAILKWHPPSLSRFPEKWGAPVLSYVTQIQDGTPDNSPIITLGSLTHLYQVQYTLQENGKPQTHAGGLSLLPQALGMLTSFSNSNATRSAWIFSKRSNFLWRLSTSSLRSPLFSFISLATEEEL